MFHVFHLLRWFRGHRNIFQKWKSSESKRTIIDARIWQTMHVFPCSFFYNLPIVSRFGTQTAAPRSVRAVPTEVTAWPALTTGMGRLGLTARRSRTPVMKGWASTRQTLLQRLRAIVGKNAMGGRENIVPIVSRLGWTLPGAGTKILTGGTKVDSCLVAQSVREMLNKQPLWWLLSAACNPDSLPTVTNAYAWYSATELVPGATATIQCYEGYHFPGTPIAINTPEPTLPTTTAPPTPFICKSLKYSLAWISLSVSQFIPSNGGSGKAVNYGLERKLGDVTEFDKDDCCVSCQLANHKFTNFGHWVYILFQYPHIKISGDTILFFC